MGKLTDNSVLDAACAKIATANVISCCSTQPANRTEAISTYALATHAMTTGDGNGDYTIEEGDDDGRQVAMTQQADVTIIANGTANHVVLCNSSIILSITTCASQVLSTGNTVTFPTFDDQYRDPT